MVAHAFRVVRTCALCGGRDATTETELDGKAWPACDTCAHDAIDDPQSESVQGCTSISMRTFWAVTNGPGSTKEEVCARLGCDSFREKDAVGQALSRWTKRGLFRAVTVERDGLKSRAYWATGRKPKDRRSFDKMEIRDIKERRAKGEKVVSIARRYGVDVSTVSRLVAR